MPFMSIKIAGKGQNGDISRRIGFSFRLDRMWLTNFPDEKAKEGTTGVG